MRIERLSPSDAPAVLAAAHLFDDPPAPDATRRFLGSPSHHLLIAYEGTEPTGFITGVEVEDLSDGPEMLLYELGVDARHQRRGIGRALVEALLELARGRGCRGVWVLADVDNDAGHATYRSAGGRREPAGVMFTWEFARTDAP